MHLSIYEFFEINSNSSAQIYLYWAVEIRTWKWRKKVEQCLVLKVDFKG